MIFEDTGRFGSKDACRTADKSISFTDMESLSDALAKRLCAYAGKRVVILGEDEIAGGSATVRDMSSSEQRSVSLAELAEYVKSR